MNLLLFIVQYHAIYVELSESKEYVIGTIGTWQETADHCTDNGMILATFDTADDVEMLWNLCVEANIIEKTYYDCFLGYHDLDKDNKWVFTGDSEVVDSEDTDGADLWWPKFSINDAYIFWNGYGYHCGCIATHSNPWTDSLFIWHCTSHKFWGLCEVLEIDEADEEICEDYVYIDNYGGTTYETAKEICAAKGMSLASVSNDDCECIKNALSGKESVWIGLDSLDHETPFYEYSDGSDCDNKNNGKHSGACLAKKCWQNKQPLNCDEGGKPCVGMSSNGLINDLRCGDTRNAILCRV